MPELNSMPITALDGSQDLNMETTSLEEENVSVLSSQIPEHQLTHSAVKKVSLIQPPSATNATECGSSGPHYAVPLTFVNGSIAADCISGVIFV